MGVGYRKTRHSFKCPVRSYMDNADLKRLQYIGVWDWGNCIARGIRFTDSWDLQN